MPDHASVRDRVASAPWHREPLGSVLPAADSASWLTLLFARRATTAITVGMLYALSTVLLLASMSHLPDYAFNWEEYTAADLLRVVDGRGSVLDTFRLTDGLMTDSGRLPWVVVPASLGFSVDTIGLDTLRTSLAFLSALAVPLTYLLGRAVAGSATGVLAAALVALSPAFLIYGRTGTVVGLSVPIALLTALLLLRVVRAAGRPLTGRVMTLLGLQVMLIAGAYAYSPIRLFWVIALALIVVEVIAQRDDRGWLLSALAVTLLTLPVFLTLMLGLGQFSRPAAWDLRSALSAYYNAGGEQLASFVQYPSSFRNFLPAEPTDRGTGQLAWTLVGSNIRALLNLLADRDTRPPLTDYWNTHGQLYSRLLVPAAVIGAVLLLSRLRRSVEARFLLVGLVGLTMPLLATSQVHLGRLVFASPFLLVIVALGVVWLTGLLIVHLPNLILRLTRNDRGPASGQLSSFRSLIRLALALVLVVAVAAETLDEDDVRPLASQSHTPEVVAAIRAQQAAGVPAVALVLSGPADVLFERLDVATYRLMMDREARFIDASAMSPDEVAGRDDGRIDVFSGGFGGGGAERLRVLPGTGCDVVYLIPATQSAGFQPALDDLGSRCGQPPPTIALGF